MSQSILAEPNNALITDKLFRSASVDILKVAAIFAVVFIHSSFLIPFVPTKFDLSRDGIELLTSGFQFCVPVFILIWAYFAEKSVMKKGSHIVISRFYKLLIPFFFWSAVYFILIADFKHTGIVQMITKHWTGYGWSGQYYFIILFQLLLLFPFISRVTHHLLSYRTIIVLLSIAFFFGVSYSGWLNISAVSKLNDRPFIYWLPLVMLGIVFANVGFFKIKIPAFVAIASVLLIILEKYLYPNLSSPHLMPSVFIVTLILTNTAFKAKVDYEKLNPVLGNTIRNIAENTLGIFCLNPLVNMLLSPVLPPLKNHIQFPGCSVMIPLLSTLLVISICMLVIATLKKIRVGFLVAN